MRHAVRPERALTTLVLVATLVAPARAAPLPVFPDPVPIPAATDLHQTPLPMAGLPANRPENWERMLDQRVVRNVTRPTITPFLPDPAHATGAAVIIAPGGAFAMLSIDNEGTLVAHWLVDHGIAAFVLKYRLTPTPADPHQAMAALAPAFEHPDPAGAAVNLKTPAIAWAQADALAAIGLVRSRAAAFHVDPARIGIIGFSAGAITAMNAATGYTAATRPDFVGEIYGAMPDRPVPVDAPPVFAAVAADDPLLRNASLPVFQAWRAAGKSAELHIYAAGGHGFGLVPHATTSDHWIDEFYWWLEASGVLAH